MKEREEVGNGSDLLGRGSGWIALAGREKFTVRMGDSRREEAVVC